MMCTNPYVNQVGMAYGCGQCMPCRVNKRRIWSHRIMLESRLHRSNAFVTLTYADENLPEGGSLDPKHGQDWLKRLRRRTGAGLRYFFVGEYGDQTDRPHYHAALFGLRCDNGVSRYNSRGLNCCAQCRLVQDSWGWGNIYLGVLEPNSAEYIAGYVTKKLTAKDDSRLNGRHPEFARMSLRPGIGYHALHEVASIVMQYHLAGPYSDVPTTLRNGPRELPLGRYLTRGLRKLTGKEESAPQSTLDEVAAELLPLRLAAKTDSEAPSLRDQIVKAGKVKVARAEALRRIYKKDRRL